MKRRPRLLAFLVRVRHADAVAAIPERHALRRGNAKPKPEGPSRALDATLRDEGDVLSFSRVFQPRAALRGERAPVFSEEEESYGLSRTFEVVVHTDRPTAVMLEAFRKCSLVEGACLNRFVSHFAEPTTARASDPAQSSRWAFEQANFGEALALEPGDPAVKVAVLDSGVDARHPEFDQRLQRGEDFVDAPSEIVEDAGIRLIGDFRDRDDDPADDVGHGTLVSSILCARGAKMAPGAAGRCSVFPLRVLAGARRENGSIFGIGTYADIDSALKYAVDHGAKVINCSLGSLPPGDTGFGLVPHQDSIRYALAHGCVVVAAAGNSGRREHFVPASLPGVLAVGAVSPEHELAPFSTRGGHVRLLAPGVRIYGAAIGGGYRASSGTSYAAPFVTAMAALAFSAFERRGVRAAASLVRELLVFAARAFARDPAQMRSVMIDAAEAVAMAIKLAEARAGTPLSKHEERRSSRRARDEGAAQRLNDNSA